MKPIPLTKGLCTFVDDERYEELSKHKWYAQLCNGHFRGARKRYDVKGKPKIIYIYHQILGRMPWELRALGLEVDHIDGNPMNNQMTNLRVVTHAENMRNSSTHLNRVGVCYDKTHGKWKSYLDRIGLKRMNLGTYLTREEAEAALAVAKQQHP